MQVGATSSPFRLAVLECDTPVPAVERERGTYGDVFDQLLRRGLAHVGDSHADTQFALTKWDVVRLQQFPEPGDVDGILLSGSKHTAFEDEPWILALVDYVGRWLRETSKPAVGICFGHQIIARALGAEVQRSPGGWEVSVDRIETTPEGRELLGPSVLSLHQMHRDAVLEVPRGLVNLGSSPRCAIQGLYRPGRVLSFQAHPEFDAFIMAKILELRRDQRVFDQAMFHDGMARAQEGHDGVLVATSICRFLLGTRHGEQGER